MWESLRALYARATRRQERSERREVIRALRAVPIFRDFPGRALGELAEMMHVRHYRRDEVLYYERDPGLGLYVIQRGRVRLLVEDEAGVLQEFRQAGEGELVGEISLLSEYRRQETVQALTDTHVLGFFRPDLKAMLKRTPRTGAAVVEALARRLAMNQVALLQHVIERGGKVAALSLRDGTPAPADTPFPVPPPGA